MTDREMLIADTFVELADTLVDDFDVVDFMGVLVERAVALLAVDAGGIMLSDPRGELQVLAASSHAAQVIELFEVQNDEGPCLDAFRTGTAVYRPDLVSTRASWPRFTPRMEAAGFSSAHAIPMRLRSEVIGALNLFMTAPGGLSAADRKLGQALADVATVGLLQARSIAARTQLAEQLQGALTSRVTIEQAKGVLAERAGIDVDQAFTLIRTQARRSGRALVEVAGEIIAAETTLPS